MKYQIGQTWESPSKANTITFLSLSADGSCFKVRHKNGHETWMPDGYEGLKDWILLPTEEVRVTNPKTGGQKGKKPEAYAYIPTKPLAELARVYNFGCHGKPNPYEPWNWTRGYDWSLSLSALFRHIEHFRDGTSKDEESGLHHLAHAAFHLFALMEFERTGVGKDDRWTK